MKKFLTFVTAVIICVAGIYFTGSEAAFAAGGGGSKKDGEDFQFVEISPLVFPVVNDNGAYQMISLVVSIEVKDSHDADKIARMTPRLNDAYIQSLYGYLSKETNFENGTIKVKEVKKRLNEITEKVIGGGNFNDVLLQVVQQHPI